MLIRPAVFASLSLLIAPLTTRASEGTERPWNHEIVYSVLLDRFFDGDPANNVPAGSDPALYDKAQQDLAKYHGGDLRGLELAIQRGHFSQLGVTTLAISAPMRAVWRLLDAAGAPKAGYDGDCPQDFLDIDPHWTSAKSADGKTTYPDSRDGRMQHYKDFVALAHSRGLKVIQDAVLNHAGPVFFYDANGDGKLDADSREEWAPAYRAEGPYANATWCDLPQWNAVKAEPSGPVTVLGREVKTTGILADLKAYNRRGFSEAALAKDEEGKHCDLVTRRDLTTTAGTPTFDQLVDEFVEIYAFYIEEIGVDGLRMNWLKQTHRVFWDAFTHKLRERIGPERAKSLLIIGTVNDANANEVAKYTYRKDSPEDDEPCFDSLMNRPFCLGVREYLRPVVGPYGKARAVETAWTAFAAQTGAKPKLNARRGADGLASRQKLLNFVEDAGELNRFRVGPISEKQSILANALAILNNGIPCLYYGAEAGMLDAKGKIGKDGETGRLTLVPAGLAENFEYMRKTPSYQAIAALNALRQKLPALTDGALSPLWSDKASSDTDDGVFAFVRYIRPEGGGAPEDFVIVAINASERARATSAGAERMKLVTLSGKPLLAQGQKLTRLPIAGLDAGTPREQVVEVVWHENVPQVELLLAPQTVNIYRVMK